MRYTRKSERTVRAALARLEAEGLIRPGAPDIVATHIKRPDRRPRGWDLPLDRIRTDLDGEELAALEAQYPGIRQRVAVARAHQEGADESEPATERSGQIPVDNAVERLVENRSDGVQLLHPVHGTGCNQSTHGVQISTHGVQPLHPNRT